MPEPSVSSNPVPRRRRTPEPVPEAVPEFEPEVGFETEPGFGSTMTRSEPSPTAWSKPSYIITNITLPSASNCILRRGLRAASTAAILLRRSGSE